MTNEPLACPYCNAFVSAPPGATRVPCPRCGETFTLRQPAGVQNIPLPPAVDPSPAPRRPNRVVAAWVLAGMALMASVGLAFALYTTGTRRAHDTAMPPPPRKSPLIIVPTPATPPAALEALHWLPPETTLVAGVQVAELRQTDAGRETLQRLLQAGKLKADAASLEQWTGLKIDQIDHLVVGLRAEDGIPPPGVLVVRTIRPYDAASVKAALHAEASADAAGREVYKCRPPGAGLRPFVWFADDRTLVFGLLAKHLDAVPDKPAAGSERLSREVRELVGQRLQAGGPVWAAGHSADWRKTGAALFLGEVPEKDYDLLGGVHDFALQLEAGAPQRLTASFRCADAPTAVALEARLTEAWKPNARDGFETARDGPWVTVQRRGDAAAWLAGLAK